MSPRPFNVDPAVMSNIRPMAAQDAAAVADLHHSAMGKSTWAMLGKGFLQALYASLIDDERFLGFVYVEDGEVSGFIAGSQDTDQMMSHTFKRSWLLLTAKAIPRILNPTVLRRLIETHRYTDLSGGTDIPESLFCSFKPSLRGRRISGHINKVLFDELLARGHHFVKVTTEVDNEGANRQLTSWGFTDEGHFTFYGKDMVRYVLNLDQSERVEAVSRHPTI
jgi:RimJ/RimL family protein N-acetyltransferase